MSKKIDQMTDEEKAEQYKQYISALKKDMGIDNLEQKVDKLLEFLKPGTEKEKEKISPEDKNSLLEADDVLEFLDRAAGIAQKYGVIEGQSEPFSKFMFMLGNQYMEMMSWRMREDIREWDKMKQARQHSQ